MPTIAINMGLARYPSAPDDGEEPARRSQSIIRSRHVSLQSRVDSLAAESIWDGDQNESVPDIPTVYRTNEDDSSTFLVYEPDYIRPLQTAYTK